MRSSGVIWRAELSLAGIAHPGRQRRYSTVDIDAGAAPVERRLELRIPVSYVLQVAIGLMIVAAFMGFFGVGFLLSGVAAGLIFLLPVPIFTRVVDALLQMRLWADDSTVGMSNHFVDRSIPRSELAMLRIGKPYSRAGASCNFVRRDGAVGFRTSERPWRSQLEAFARFLSVPLVDERRLRRRGWRARPAGRSAPVAPAPSMPWGRAWSD